MEATNPSARRIMYAHWSIARCLLNLKKYRGTREMASSPCKGLGPDSEVVIPKDQQGLW